MIKIRGLKHRWSNSQSWILDIPELDINLGDSVALMGPSGSGKSTLLAIISGFIKPTKGQIWVNGIALHSLNDKDTALWRAHHLSWQSTYCPLIPFLSVEDNVELNRWFLGDHSDPDHQKTDSTRDWLTDFKLEPDLISQSVDSLSLGEKQRLEVLRALKRPTSYTLLDEPTSHLDYLSADRLNEIIFTKRKAPYKTLIIATHNPKLAQHCDHIIELGHKEYNDHPPLASTNIHVTESMSMLEDIKVYPQHSPVMNKVITDSYSAWIKGWSFAWKQYTYDVRMYCVILLASLFALLIPIMVESTIERFQHMVSHRAKSTSLIIGALNSPFELFFGGLYFSKAPDHSMPVIQADDLLLNSQLDGTPILVAPRIDSLPLIATDATYYHYRQFHFIEGRKPQQLGEVCLSKASATQRSLELGMKVSTQPNDLFALTAPYPIELTIVGLFEAKDPSDQFSHFTTLSTGWAALGYSHSHRLNTGQLNESLVIDQKLRPPLFHTHYDPDQLPISALLIHTHLPKEVSLLKARLSQKNHIFTVIEPQKVAQQTLTLTRNIHKILKPLLLMLSGLTLFLISLMLTQKYLARAPIRKGLFALGLSKNRIFLLSLQEYLIFTSILLLVMVVIFSSIRYFNGWEIMWLKLLSLDILAPT